MEIEQGAVVDQAAVEEGVVVEASFGGVLGLAVGAGALDAPELEVRVPGINSEAGLRELGRLRPDRLLEGPPQWWIDGEAA